MSATLEWFGCTTFRVRIGSSTLPPHLPGVAGSDAERRLRDQLGADRYTTRSYGAPVPLFT